MRKVVRHVRPFGAKREGVRNVIYNNWMEHWHGVQEDGFRL